MLMFRSNVKAPDFMVSYRTFIIELCSPSYLDDVSVNIPYSQYIRVSSAVYCVYEGFLMLLSQIQTRL